MCPQGKDKVSAQLEIGNQFTVFGTGKNIVEAAYAARRAANNKLEKELKTLHALEESLDSIPVEG